MALEIQVGNWESVPDKACSSEFYLSSSASLISKTEDEGKQYYVAWNYIDFWDLGITIWAYIPVEDKYDVDNMKAHRGVAYTLSKICEGRDENTQYALCVNSKIVARLKNDAAALDLLINGLSGTLL